MSDTARADKAMNDVLIMFMVTGVIIYIIAKILIYFNI